MRFAYEIAPPEKFITKETKMTPVVPVAMRTVLPLVLSELKLKFQVFGSAKDHLLQALY